MKAFVMFIDVSKFNSVPDKQNPSGGLVNVFKDTIAQKDDETTGKYFFDKKCRKCDCIFYSKPITIKEYENLADNPNVDMYNGHAILVSKCNQHTCK